MGGQYDHDDGAGEGELPEVQPVGSLPRSLLPCDPAGLDHRLPTPQIQLRGSRGSSRRHPLIILSSIDGTNCDDLDFTVEIMRKRR